MARTRFFAAIGAEILAVAAAGACVDLDSLGAGRRDASSDGAEIDAPATPGAVRFCDSADAGNPLFCDDFDDPSTLGNKWPGAPELKTPAHVGAASFDSAAPELPSSPPFAVVFNAQRDVDAIRPLAVFAKDLIGSTAPAFAMMADIRLQTLKDLAPPDDGGAAIDARADAAASADARVDANAGDARADPPIPNPHVHTIGFVSMGLTLDGVEIVLSPAALHLVTGASDGTLRRVKVADLDYLQASQADWIHIAVVVGEPSSVEAFAHRASGRSVTCPRSGAVAAAWPSIPPNTIQCVEASPAFGPIENRHVGAAIGIGLDTPSVSQLLVDSVRVLEVRSP
jgi:hypothetical protein